MLIDRLHHGRYKLSSLISLAGVLAVYVMAQSLQAPAEMVAQEAIELTTTLIEPLLQRAPATPQPPKRAEPQQVVTREAPMAMPAETFKALTPTEPSRPSPLPTQAMPQLAPAQALAEAPKVVAQIPVNVNVENNYVSNVRATLNANKRYPTGREASLQRPAGKARVWFVLFRNGSLQEAGIEESSNSILLDNAALTTVRRTDYAPWPEGSWPSQTQHKFTVTLDFVPFN